MSTSYVRRTAWVALVAACTKAGPGTDTSDSAVDATPTVAFAIATSSVPENGGTATVAVTLASDRALTGALSVAVTANASGTAVPGTHYVLDAAPLTFPVGSVGGATASTRLQIVDDDVAGGIRTVVLDLAATGATLGDLLQHTLTIADDEIPTFSVAFTSAASSVAEEADATIDVVLSTNQTLTTSVTVNVVDAGTGTASVLDYAPPATTVTFPAGSTSGAVQHVTVHPVDDAAPEDAETLVLALRDATVDLGATTTHTLTLTDTDPITATVAFAADASAVDEGLDATLTVTLTTDLALREAVTVAVATSGTATSGEDYTVDGTQVTFAVGSPTTATRTVTVHALADAVDELPETVVLTLHDPAGGALGAIEAHTLTVGDPDVRAPIATHDAYDAVPNTPIAVSAVSGVLANDTGRLLAVSASDSTSSQGGTVAVAADGSFTYTPPHGLRATADTFDYTATNGLGSASATVTVTLGAHVLWCVDDSAPSGGDGTLAAPFDALHALTGVVAGDTVYLFAGEYVGNLVLVEGGRLVGEGAALVFGGALLRAAGAAPTLRTTSGDAITLASDNVVAGLIVGDTPGGTAFADTGDVGDLHITAVRVTGDGGVLTLTNGSGAGALVTLDAVDSSGAPGAAIDLLGFAGRFTVTGDTTIVDPAGDGIRIEDATDTAALSFGAVGVDRYGERAVSLTRVAGTIALGDLTLGDPADGPGAAEALRIETVARLTLGDVTIESARESAVSIDAQAVDSSLDVGDVTVLAPVDRFALYVAPANAGSITLGAVVGAGASGYEAVRVDGVAGSSVGLTALTVTSDPSVQVSGGADVDLGRTSMTGLLRILGASGTVTFHDLTQAGGPGGFEASASPDATVVLLGTTSLQGTGSRVFIDGVHGDDGAGNGWMFHDISTPHLELANLTDDVTVTHGTTLTATPALMVSYANGHTITLGGPTTLGTSTRRVTDAMVLGAVAGATLVLDSPTVYATRTGLAIDAAMTLGLTGAPAVVDVSAGAAVFLRKVTPLGGSWTFGDVTSAGSGGYGLRMEEIPGDAVFSGATTVRGGGVLLHLAGSATFDGPVLVADSAVTGGNGLRVMGVTQLRSGPEGDITIDNVSGPGAVGLRLGDLASVWLEGDLSLSRGNSFLLRVDGCAGQTLAFLGKTSMDSSVQGGPVYLNSAPDAKVTFADLHMRVRGNDVAINTRGGRDHSCAGMELTLGALTEGAGIVYPGYGDRTAIHGDQLGALTVQGTAEVPFRFVGVGSSGGDNSDVGVTGGPHAIYCRDCARVAVDHVVIDALGDRPSDGQESGVYVENDTVALQAVTVTDSSFRGIVDGDGVFVRSAAGGHGRITLSGDAFGAVSAPNAGGHGVRVLLDGSSADLAVTASTFVDVVGALATGIDVDLTHGAGADDPVLLRIGDGTAQGAVSISNVMGDGIALSVADGARLVALLDAFSASTPIAELYAAAVRVEVDDTDGATTADVTLRHATIGGCFYPAVAVDHLGGQEGSEARVALTDSLLSGCGDTIGVASWARNGPNAGGVFDVTVSDVDFGGSSLQATVEDDAIARLYLAHATDASEFRLHLGANAHLVIGDDGGSSVTGASQPQVRDVLQDTDGNGNQNTYGNSYPLVWFHGGASAQLDIVPQAGSTGIAAPATP